MSQPKALLGEIMDQNEDPRVDLKRQQLETLERKIKEKRAELADMESAAKSIAGRLYNAFLALQAFFEIHEAPSGEDASSTASSDTLRPHDETKWQAWKQRLPEPTGRIIDALLVQPLTATQIATQARIHTTNVSKYMAPLKNNGLLEQDGSRWKLKRL